MENFDLKRYSHLGDAVYEVFIRENIIFKAKSLNLMHKLTTAYVNADFQAQIAKIIYDEILNDEEKDIFRRARNLPLNINKRNKPQIHRSATALEVMTGLFYLTDKGKLDKIFEIVKAKMDNSAFLKEGSNL